MKTDQKENIRIVLTGGHAATPGIALIEKLKDKFGDNLSINWIGSKNAIEGSVATSLEYKIFPSMGVKFWPINAGKIQTKLTKHTLKSLLKIPVGFIEAFFILLKIKPKMILSFGGYSSFPVVFWGWAFRIPVVLHEQTVVAGRANIAASFFARKIALSRLESSKFFPKNKIVLTGNPLMKEITSLKYKRKLGSTPVILVLGGSRGSEFINEQIIEIAPLLIKKYKIIHVAGDLHFDKIAKHARKGYEILKSIDPKEMAKYYDISDLIISRSGANTVSEILFIKRPTIFIPLPRTFMNEQVENANYAQNFGIAKVVLENDATPKRLIAEIDDSFKNWNNIVKSVVDKKSPDINSTNLLLEQICNYI